MRRLGRDRGCAHVVILVWAVLCHTQSVLPATRPQQGGAQRIRVAHSIVISGWHMLAKNEPYREPAVATLTEKQKAKVVKRSVKKLKNLGYEVDLKPLLSVVPVGSG